MFPHLGEIALIAIIVLIIFGLGRLPTISEHLARGLRAYRDEAGRTPPATSTAPAAPAHERDLEARRSVEDAEVER